MPVYEYAHVEPADCDDFECFQHMREEPLTECPECHAAVRKLISRCSVTIKTPGLSSKESVKRFLKETRPHHINPMNGEKIIFKGPKDSWDAQAFESYQKCKPELKRSEFRLLNK